MYDPVVAFVMYIDCFLITSYYYVWNVILLILESNQFQIIQNFSTKSRECASRLKSKK
jgi:hypothetical protein